MSCTNKGRWTLRAKAPWYHVLACPLHDNYYRTRPLVTFMHALPRKSAECRMHMMLLPSPLVLFSIPPTSVHSSYASMYVRTLTISIIAFGNAENEGQNSCWRYDANGSGMAARGQTALKSDKLAVFFFQAKKDIHLMMFDFLQFQPVFFFFSFFFSLRTSSESGTVERRRLSEIDKRLLSLFSFYPCHARTFKEWLNSLLYITGYRLDTAISHHIAYRHRSPVISGTSSIWGKSRPSLWFEPSLSQWAIQLKSALTMFVRLTGLWMKVPHWCPYLTVPFVT